MKEDNRRRRPIREEDFKDLDEIYEDNKKDIYDVEDDGVFLDTSNEYDEYIHVKDPFDELDRDSYRFNKEKNEKKEKRIPLDREKEVDTKEMTPYILIASIMGILVCIIAFGLAVNALRKDSKKPDKLPLETKIEEEDLEELDLLTMEAALLAKTKSSKAMTFLNLETDEEIVLSIDSQTKIKDKYEDKLHVDKFSIGDIVNISYDKEENKLISMTKSNKGFILEDISGLTVVAEGHTIIHNGINYSFDDKTIFEAKGMSFNPGELEKVDRVTIKGYRGETQRILHVELLKGHGYLYVENQEDIIDGVLEIGLEHRMPLEDTERVAMPEGEHSIVIKGKNITPFTDTINIHEGEEVLYSPEVTFNASTVTFDNREEGADIGVNGQLVPAGDTLLLPYGTYEITAQKEGYVPISKRVDIKEPKVSILIEMAKKPVIIDTKRLYIVSDPEGADVYINNVYQGRTPLTVEVEKGQHSLTISKEGYIDSIKNMPITVQDENLDYNFELQPAGPIID